MLITFFRRLLHALGYYDIKSRINVRNQLLYLGYRILQMRKYNRNGGASVVRDLSCQHLVKSTAEAVYVRTFV